LHVSFSYGDGALASGNKNPIAGLAMGFDKTFECKSEPNRHARQQQQIQI
jgi:hypothetical protein